MYEDFTGLTMKVVLVGVTQTILIVIYVFAVAQNIRQHLSKTVIHDELFFPGYIIASVLKASYSVGVRDTFQSIHSQTFFWLEIFALNGRRSITESICIFPNMTETELECHDCDDSTMVAKISILIRFLLAILVKMYGELFVTIVLPFHLSLSRDPITFVLCSTAAYFIFQLDTYDENVKFWLSVGNPTTRSSKSGNENGFEHTILQEDDDSGVEIRQYPSYHTLSMIRFRQ